MNGKQTNQLTAEEIENPHCDAAPGTFLAHSPEIARQIDWEREGIERGIAAYREAEAKTFNRGDVADLSPVQAIMKRLAVPLAEAIRTAQDKIEASMLAAGTRTWQFEVMSLPPEKLTVITLSCALRGVLVGPGDVAETSTRIISSNIAKVIQAELEYERWASARDLEDDDKEARQERSSLVKRLAKAYPQLNRQVWKKWKKKIELISAEPWELETCLQVGGALLSMLQEIAGGLITIKDIRVDARSSMSRITGSEELAALLADGRARVEIARPKLLPMVVPPRPWTADTITSTYIASGCPSSDSSS